MHSSPDRERRAHERVYSTAGSGLTAELRAGSGRAFPAHVINTSAGGVRVSFPDARPPRFYLGTQVEIRFHVPGAVRPLIALGQISNQDAVDGVPAVGVRFSERQVFLEQLTPDLWKLFNRRRRGRLRFQLDPPFQAQLEAGSDHWLVPIHDLSVVGLGLAVEEELSEQLHGFELVQLQLNLGEPLGDVRLGAVRVHQTPFGHTVRHGHAYDSTHTVEFREQQLQLEAFLKQHVRALRG